MTSKDKKTYYIEWQIFDDPKKKKPTMCHDRVLIREMSISNHTRECPVDASTIKWGQEFNGNQTLKFEVFNKKLLDSNFKRSK